MSEILEAIMVVCFGLSWPIAIVKSYHCRTAKGKSIFFMIFIFIGYIAGIIGKFVGHNVTYVVFFYVLNSIMVLIDVVLYYRNKKIDDEMENTI